MMIAWTLGTRAVESSIVRKIAGGIVSPRHRSKIYIVIAAFLEAGMPLSQLMKALAANYAAAQGYEDVLDVVTQVSAQVEDEDDDGAVMLALIGMFRTSMMPEEGILLKAVQRILTRDEDGSMQAAVRLLRSTVDLVASYMADLDRAKASSR
jgi:hypothetical protein